MVPCNNCSNPAKYVFIFPTTAHQLYCEPCVPWSLRDRRESSRFVQPEDQEAPSEVSEEPTAAPKPARKKKATPKAVTADEHADS